MEPQKLEPKPEFSKPKPVPKKRELPEEKPPELALETAPEPVQSSTHSPQSQSPPKPEREEVPGMFQAIGVVEGIVKFKVDETTTTTTATVTIEGKEYPLLYAGRTRTAFDALKKEIQRTGEQQRLVVYPKIIHFPDRDKPPQISFQLVGFSGNNENESSASKELTPLEFKLSGLWQFIPVSRTPCISVFKNFSESRKEFVKTTEDLARKVKFMKASHIPLMWRDAIVPPFRFNPKLDKEQQGKPYFVSIKARFNPQRNVFEFDSITAMPQEKAPRFMKASKDDKAQVLRAKMQALKASAPNQAPKEGKTKKVIQPPLKKVPRSTPNS